MYRKHYLIDEALAFYDFAQSLRMRWKLRRLFPAAKNAIRHRYGSWPGNADERDSTFAGRR
jgi:hypothetical protein